MRNTINVNTNETTATKTLAEILAERAALRATEEQQRRDEIESRARDRADEAIEWLAGCLNDRISQQMRDALNLTYGYHRDDDTECEYAHARFDYGEDHAGACWEIRYIRGWDLIGPDGYRVTFDYGRYGERPFDAPILDALDGYPAWLEQKHEQAAKATTKRTVPTYSLVESDFSAYLGIEHRGVLHDGAHITIWTVPATTDEYNQRQIAYTGKLVAWNEQWILLTSDTSGIQRLIPMHRIDEIQPELPYEKEETEEQKPRQPVTDSPMMEAEAHRPLTDNDIPF